MKKTVLSLFATALIALSTTSSNAEVVVVGTQARVYEMPQAKPEYASLNNEDIPIVLNPGMAFNLKEKKAGWYKIEYAPGIHGMITQNDIIDPTKLKIPVPGKYNVANNPKENIEILQTAGKWILKSGKTALPGTPEGKIIIFRNKEIPAYSLVNIAGKGIVFNYDNLLTRFF